MQSGRCVALAAWFVFLSLANTAQAEDTQECRAALDEFSWVFVEKADYAKLRSRGGLGTALHSVECSQEELIQWHEENGWTHTNTISRAPDWFGVGDWRYQSDSSLRFCRVRPFLTRWRTNGCSGEITIIMFEGRISFIHAGRSK